MVTAKISDSTGDRDLFGNTVLPIRDRRGRKSFAKTKENQRFVMDRAADGWSQSAISTVLGCHEDTLRKYFSGELKDAHLHVMSEMLDILHRTARKGNMAAVRMVMDRSERAVAPPPRKPVVEKFDAQPASKALGKKEQKLIDAQSIPDDWGDIRDRRHH